MAGVGVSLTTFQPLTTALSSAVNANFSNLNTANVFTTGGITIQNNDWYFGYDTFGAAQRLISLNADNDVHIRTSPANKNFKVTKTDGSADIAVFNDTTGLTLPGVAPISTVTANIFQIAGAGAAFNLLSGSISRVSYFTGTGSTTGVAHGLGATPHLVIVVLNTTSPLAVTATNYTSTTVDIYVETNASAAWKAMAFHT